MGYFVKVLDASDGGIHPLYNRPIQKNDTIKIVRENKEILFFIGIDNNEYFIPKTSAIKLTDCIGKKARLLTLPSWCDIFKKGEIYTITGVNETDFVLDNNKSSSLMAERLELVENDVSQCTCETLLWGHHFGCPFYKERL